MIDPRDIEELQVTLQTYLMVIETLVERIDRLDQMHSEAHSSLKRIEELITSSYLYDLEGLSEC